MTRRLQFQVAGLVAIVLGYVAHFRLLDARIQDDAYISFRYARHLAQGQGLVWNIGERVEGYTNFLWTLLLAIPQFFSRTIDPLPFSRALSSFSGYAAMVLSFLLVRHLRPKARVLPLIPPVLLAGSWPFAINTMTGLETVFYGALLTGATFLLLRELDDLRYRGSSVLFALAALTRPEANLLSLFLFCLVAWTRRTEGKPVTQYCMRLGLPFLGLVGAHEIFRLAYYGEWVPNTYFAKFGIELPAGMPTRGSYLLDFFAKGFEPEGIAAFLVLLFAVLERQDLKARILLVGGLFGVLNVALGGPDFMIGFRYLVPYLPLLYVCTALGVHAVSQRVRKTPAKRSLEWAAFAVFFVSGIVGYSQSLEKLRPFEQLRYRVNADSNTALGHWLHDALPKDAVVVARDIGEIGYLSDLPLVDTTGLTDRSIARQSGNVLDRTLNVAEIFARNPSVFVFVSKSPRIGLGPQHAGAYSSPQSTRALLEDPRMAEQFVFFARYPSYDSLRKTNADRWIPVTRGDRQSTDSANTYYLEVYLRKDLAESLRK